MINFKTISSWCLDKFLCIVYKNDVLALKNRNKKEYRRIILVKNTTFEGNLIVHGNTGAHVSQCHFNGNTALAYETKFRILNDTSWKLSIITIKDMLMFKNCNISYTLEEDVEHNNESDFYKYILRFETPEHASHALMLVNCAD